VAEFLTTNGTSDRLERIIKEARRELVLVSPYLQLSQNLIERLQDADKLKVKIVVIYREDKLKPEEEAKIDTLKNLSLYCKDNLHAKCFYNENHLIITSMNIYEFSEKTNREMGVWVDRDEDEVLYSKAVEEVESILHSQSTIKRQSRSGLATMGKALVSSPEIKGGLAAMGKAFMGVVNDLVDDAPSTPKKGFCIRCAQAIDFDAGHPLCREDFVKWNVHKNPEYPEKYCHRCGKRNKVCKDRPLCLPCYRRQ
jgi:hypothetical protein